MKELLFYRQDRWFFKIIQEWKKLSLPKKWDHKGTECGGQPWDANIKQRKMLIEDRQMKLKKRFTKKKKRKKRNVSLLTHPRVIPNPYDFDKNNLLMNILATFFILFFYTMATGSVNLQKNQTNKQIKKIHTTCVL